MASVQDTLKERNNTHGDFDQCAEASQALKTTVPQFCPSLSNVQAEGLDMIFTKIARILAGNPCHIDTWHDIAGYATLVVRDLEKHAAIKEATDE